MAEAAASAPDLAASSDLSRSAAESEARDAANGSPGLKFPKVLTLKGSRRCGAFSVGVPALLERLFLCPMADARRSTLASDL